MNHKVIQDDDICKWNHIDCYLYEEGIKNTYVDVGNRIWGGKINWHSRIVNNYII